MSKDLQTEGPLDQAASSTTCEIDHKFFRLKESLAAMESLVVAFSGGVDSTFLLRVAKEALGDKLLAVSAESETSSRREIEDSRRLAQELGVRRLVIKSEDLKSSEFVKNSPDRCYICKKNRFSAILSLARSKGFKWVADGSNLDDESDYRPGMKAVVELGVRSPLMEAGLSKAQIRILSKSRGLSTWDKPAYACLATRIPYGSPISAEKLAQVDAAEEMLRAILGCAQVRVRHFGDAARIEAPVENLAKILENNTRLQIVEFFKGLGFRFVTLDLEGYRMGSLNHAQKK